MIHTPGPECLRSQDLVIGSGPGGAITAALLAEAGRDVAILEEGRCLPLESCEPFSIAEVLQKYRCGGLNPAFGRPTIALAEGCCAGGGSEINGALYHRTPEEVLALWRERYEVRDLGPTEMEPHFRFCEEALSVCLTPGETPAASRKLLEGADSLGWRAMEVPRCFHYDGGAGPDGSPLGTRQSMTKTFLPRAISAGARLVTETRAVVLDRQHGRWNVTLARRDGGVAETSAPTTAVADAVFVCGGAVETPALLRRSGITRHIGNSLALHPTVKVAARFPEEVNHEHLGVPVHQVREFAPQMSLGCSVSSLPYLMLGTADYPEHRERIRGQWRQMAVYYAMIAGPGSGTVRNAGPGRQPNALVRYGLSSDDLRQLGLGLRRLCRLLFAAGAVELYPSISGMPPLRGEDDLSLLPAQLPADRTSLMTVHLFSSCPMGDNRALCAADSFGRVHGVPNLFLHDASLLCTAPGVNPQGSIMALARRNTQHYLETR
jgi:choline dehydrogenase-like flavoprotein